MPRASVSDPLASRPSPSALGGDDDARTIAVPAAQRVCNQALFVAGLPITEAVRVGRVEEGDTGVERRMEQLDRTRLVPIGLGRQTHATDSQRSLGSHIFILSPFPHRRRVWSGMFRVLSRMFRVIRVLSAVAGLLFTAFLLGVRSPSDVRTMAATVVSAVREATRPSDAALGCAAIEKELVATMSAPAIQGLASKTGAAAQKNFAALQKDGPMTGQMAATIAASLARGVQANQT